MDTMDTTTLIIETVHEQFLNLYDALVLSERGILTDIMTIRSKLLQAENSLSILAEQLKARFMKASTFPQKKELTFYGKKHIIKIEEEAERIADRFFETTDYAPGYYFLLASKYQAECQRLDHHTKRGRS